MGIIYMDESGYTGADLFNAAQPFYSLATHSIPAEACELLFLDHFAGGPQSELKFSQLWRRPRNREKVLSLLGSIPNPEKLVKVYVTHKRYALLARMIDLLIEPIFFDAGIDFYERGWNIAFTNLAYMCIPSFAGHQYFRDLLSSFQDYIRNRGGVEFDRFYGILFNPQEPCELVEILSYFRMFDSMGMPELPEDVDLLDITIASGLPLLQAWGQESGGFSKLVADDSTRLRRESWIWQALGEASIEPVIVGQDRRSINLPISLDGIELGDSKTGYALQIADLIAGASVRVFRIAQDSLVPPASYELDLRRIFDRWYSDGLVPHTGVTPEALGTLGVIHQDGPSVIGRILSDYQRRMGGS